MHGSCPGRRAHPSETRPIPIPSVDARSLSPSVASILAKTAAASCLHVSGLLSVTQTAKKRKQKVLLLVGARQPHITAIGSVPGMKCLSHDMHAVNCPKLLTSAVSVEMPRDVRQIFVLPPRCTAQSPYSIFSRYQPGFSECL